MQTIIDIPILKIVDAIDQAARLFLNPDHSLRKEAESALAQSSSKEMAQFVLDDCFSQLTSRSLIQLLEEELGDPLILDMFRPKRHGRGWSRAYGPRMITHILPGNVPCVSIISLVCALLVKSESIAKISEKVLAGDVRPAGGVPPSSSLPALFVRGLQSVNEMLAQSITLTSWGHEQTLLTAEAFHRAELVILYGSDQTIETLRPYIPRETRVIVHGPKVSLGIVAREAIARQVAQDAAWDIALYDQCGCLSPHLYYVEESGADAPIVFAQWVAEALETIPLPKGIVSPSAGSAIQQLRGTIPLKGRDADLGGAVFASKEGVDWTVLYDPDPAFSYSPLSRTVFIKPIKTLSDVGVYLEPIIPHLQAVGVAVSDNFIWGSKSEALLNQLGLLGVCRICPIGKMQKPPLTWHHDGRFRILDLLRFLDWEGDQRTAKI